MRIIAVGCGNNASMNPIVRVAGTASLLTDTNKRVLIQILVSRSAFDPISTSLEDIVFIQKFTPV